MGAVTRGLYGVNVFKALQLQMKILLGKSQNAVRKHKTGPVVTFYRYFDFPF